MHQASEFQVPVRAYPAFGIIENPMGSGKRICCSWESLRAQLLMQWNRLKPFELDQTGPDREKLARLIQEKYGISAALVENYLRNFERTLPVI